MKKIFILLFIFILFLYSCKNVNNTGSIETNTNPYYYYGMNRINMFTGAITSLCIDPLCDHKTDSCPLYYYDSIDKANLYNNHVYFMSIYSRFKLMKLFDPNSIGINKIFSYDIENNKLSVIYEFNDMYDLYTFDKIENGQYLYYVIGLNTEKTVENSDIHKYYIIEMDLKNDSAKLIYSKEHDSIYTIIKYIKNNKIYWKEYISTNEVVYYTTDYNGENKEYIDFFTFMEFRKQNSYIYYTDDSTENNKKTKMNLYRHDYSTGETVTVLKDYPIVDWTYNSDYLYIDYGKKLYRIKNSGFDEELVLDYSDIIDSFYMSFDNFFGDYMCIPVFEKDYNTKYAGLDLIGQTSYLILNQKTLEYKLVH